jgi:hypothetical protein
MFHGVGVELNAKVTLEEKNLREFTDSMSADHKHAL